MNNFDKLKVAKPHQGALDRKTARQRPWTMAEYSVQKNPPTRRKEKTPKPARSADQHSSETPTTSAAPLRANISSYYTKQDNEFYELAITELTPSEERLYLRMYRESWGYQKSSCCLSVFDLSQMMKTDPRQIRRLRDALVKKGWVKITSQRIDAIASKNPLTYRVYAAREVIAIRAGTGESVSGLEIGEASLHQGHSDPGQKDPGQFAPDNSATHLSPKPPKPAQDDQTQPVVLSELLEKTSVLKEIKEKKKITPPYTPQAGEGRDTTLISPNDVKKAAHVVDEFYAQMKWPQQTDRIMQSDIATVLHWQLHEGFDITVIQKALEEVAKLPDTKSLKRAEYYLAPTSKVLQKVRNGNVQEDSGKIRFDEEAKIKEQRIAKLERVRQKVSDDELNELYQEQFDELQAQNPSLAIFIIETLARQKVNQHLLEQFADS